jgi:hypothetical protein
MMTINTYELVMVQAVVSVSTVARCQHPPTVFIICRLHFIPSSDSCEIEKYFFSS